jgi:hypothetical protein
VLYVHPIIGAGRHDHSECERFRQMSARMFLGPGPEPDLVVEPRQEIALLQSALPMGQLLTPTTAFLMLLSASGFTGSPEKPNGSMSAARR